MGVVLMSRKRGKLALTIPAKIFLLLGLLLSMMEDFPNFVTSCNTGCESVRQSCDVGSGVGGDVGGYVGGGVKGDVGGGVGGGVKGDVRGGVVSCMGKNVEYSSPLLTYHNCNYT